MCEVSTSWEILVDFKRFTQFVGPKATNLGRVKTFMVKATDFCKKRETTGDMG